MGEDSIDGRPKPSEPTSRVIQYRTPSGFVFGPPSRAARVVAMVAITVVGAGAVLVCMGMGGNWSGEESRRLKLSTWALSFSGVTMGLLSLFLGDRPGRARSPEVIRAAKLAVTFGAIMFIAAFLIPSLNR